MAKIDRFYITLREFAQKDTNKNTEMEIHKFILYPPPEYAILPHTIPIAPETDR